MINNFSGLLYNHIDDMNNCFISIMLIIDLNRDTSTMVSSMRAGDTSTLVTSALSHHELVYARAVVTYNSSVASGGVKPDLLAMLSDLWTEEREPEVATVWDMVRAMAEVGKERPGTEVISCAKNYLEKSYIKFIR